MDLLESYHSDDETVQDSASDSSNLKNLAPKPLEQYREKYKRLNKDGIGTRDIKIVRNHGVNTDSGEMALLSFDQKDDQTSLRSRVYIDYRNAKHMSKDVPKSTGVELYTTRKHETVLYDKNKDESLVVAIELGSRNNPSGIVRAESEFDSISTQDRATETLKEKSQTMSKKLTHEHTRKGDDMMYANYPVDHPMFKAHSSIANYTNDGSTFFLSESFGSVHSTPSGVTEKVYFNELAFQDDMLKNDLKVVVENDPKVVEVKRRRLKESEVDSEDVFGPWIPFEEGELPIHSSVLNKGESEEKEKKEKSRTKNQLASSFTKYTPEQAEHLNEVVVNDGKQTTKFNDVNVSTFHRKVDSERQYKSWVPAPKNMKQYDPETYKAYLPKQEVYTYVGHTMAVQKIDFMPKTGHYLLSASMDGFVKIWDVNNTRKCVRTYKGHSKGVRDISFIEEGSKFYSCSFDSNSILWDTEYGKIIGIYTVEKTPYCLTVCPKDERVFIVGGENKKASQFDSRTGEVVLEYAEHMGCVNTVTFIDGNRRILTTGDDKKLLVWDYNIPAVVKQISNPAMHTVPAVINHPNDKFVLAQSMDNQIVVYESSGSRFKQFGRKRFRGHQNSGYAIRPSCSHDGRYVASGDARGKLFIWDWKTCKNLQTLSGHKAVTMDCKWHPSYQSTVATCSWDGTIKLWE
ncbi:hypothetical protein MACK_001439 [Theileria orientalis]|uniref:Pre-mRNA-processing factor 17 n=1 Tax=Theileria orientalis TaxID=68886 RepID=A0A976QTG6_THEOR|nr:hypothetical protein MACK_001439 [Theileria orientalis]